MNFEVKTALITGTQNGIGLAIAKMYLLNGYNVICHYHLEAPKLDGVTLIKADFSSSNGAEVLIQEISKKNLLITKKSSKKRRKIFCQKEENLPVKNIKKNLTN